MNDRLMIAAMAMQGMLASPDCIGDAQAVSGDAIECADALLAAAGEKESAFRDLYSVTINGVEYSTTNKALVDEIARLRAELDKREGMVQIPTADWRRLTLLVYACGGKGSGPVDEIHAIIAKVEAQS